MPPSQATWNLWAELTQKYNIRKTAQAIQLIETITKLDTGAIHCPLDMAEISKKEALALDSAMQTNGTTTLLWQCAKCHFGYPTQTNLQRFNRDPNVVNKVLDRIRGKKIEILRHTENTSKLGFNSAFRKTSTVSQQERR